MSVHVVLFEGTRMSTSKQLGWRFGIHSVCSWMTLLAAGAMPLSAQTSTPNAPAPAPARPSEVRDSEPVFQVIAPTSQVSLIHLQSRTLQFSKKIVLVDGFNPDVLNVSAVTPNQIRLRAETTGVTALTVKDESDTIFNIEVFVEGDVRELKAYLQRLFPSSAIDVVSLKDSVVLRGSVTEPQAIPQIMAIAKQMYPTVHNHLQVGGVNVVQMHVKILEVSRSKVKQLGFNFLASGQKYAFGSSVGGLASIPAFATSFTAPPSSSVGTTSVPLQFAITGNSDKFQGFIDALTNESLAKVLAEPTLVTTSGRPASLISGGEFPVLVPGAVGSVSIAYKPFGVQMEAIPTVLGNGRLRLDIAPEVSERDFTSAVTSNGFTVPGITTRRVNTQVEMNFGETIMIGGLINRRRLTTSTKIPILGELPLIGAMFSKKTNDVGESELLIMVTPEMAAPMLPGQAPISTEDFMQGGPTSKELFLDGMLEVPNYGSECEGCENGMGGGMAYGQGGSGMMIQNGPANCTPSGSGSPESTLELAPAETEILTPSAPPAGEIQTMSGQEDGERVIPAGGDPFRVPSRREIPEANARKTRAARTDNTEESRRSSASNRALPGPIGPQRANTAKPTGRLKAKAPAPESVRELNP